MSATLHFLNRGLAGTGDGERFSFCGGWNVCYKPDINNPNEKLSFKILDIKMMYPWNSFFNDIPDEIIHSLIFDITSLFLIYDLRSPLIKTSVVK